MTIHVIPVGNGEPVHVADAQCWCQPYVDPEITIHHAKDCREKFERQGMTNEKSGWVNVAER